MTKPSRRRTEARRRTVEDLTKGDVIAVHVKTVLDFAIVTKVVGRAIVNSHVRKVLDFANDPRVTKVLGLATAKMTHFFHNGA